MNCDFKGIYCAPLLGVFLVTLQAATVTHLAAQTTEIPFLVNNGGVDSETSAGTASEVSIGYARIQPASGRSTPAGVAIFGLRQDGVLVSETGVPASPSISSGRIYAEVNGPVRTGLAIANPGSQDAEITFYFSDQSRTSFGAGSTTIPGGSQIARFLDEDPFNGGSSIIGTFTFSSNVPVAAVALRGHTNERLEFLMTTLPVSPLTANEEEIVYFPHFAEGAGWRTEVILVNPTDDTMAGTVQFFGPGSGSVAAQPETVTIGGQTASTFSYSIPGRSSENLRTAGTGITTQVGSVRVTPSANARTPSGVAVFSFRSGGVTVAEAGVPAAAMGQAFRLYAEATGTDAASIQTGIAIANPSSSAVEVTFQLLNPGGGATGLSGSATVAGNGQRALFLNQIEGLESLTPPFQGVLRISTTASDGIAIVGLRIRTNQRGEFLITTTPLANEADPSVTNDLFYPQLVNGGGFTTQFIQLIGSADQTVIGTLSFHSQTGAALDLELAISDSSQVSWQNRGVAWTASSIPPTCESPLVLPLPMSLSRATSVLYPGQPRSGDYKAHGGFRFDGPGQGNDVEVFAPIDADLYRGARYLEGGIVQHTFDFINSCGIMYRLDHLLELTPILQAVANTLPLGGEGQSQSTFLAPGQTIRAGEILAKKIGLPGNVFFDWGVYDLRMMNAASNDAEWLARHPGEQAPYAICWLEFLSSTDGVIVSGLPPSDGMSGAMSDYCN